jgi:hypothetical protein
LREARGVREGVRIAFKAPTKTNETSMPRRASSVDGEGTKEGVLGRGGGDSEGSKERDKRGSVQEWVKMRTWLDPPLDPPLDPYLNRIWQVPQEGTVGGPNSRKYMGSAWPKQP